MTARTGKDPGELFQALTAEFGTPYSTRVDAPATPEQKEQLKKLSPDSVQASTLAGEPITAKLTRAPGNDAPIGGLKVVAANGWFAARPSGTENIYKIYAESFRDRAHLDAILAEAQRIVNEALAGAGPAYDRAVNPNGRGRSMKATQKLHDLGQSLWLDNITRDLLDSGTLKRYIDELSVTGLTSNPTIFDQAIKKSTLYDAAIRERLAKGKSGEALFFELALEDLTRAADLFRPVYDRTDGVDGWVSLEVSPLLAYDTKSTLAAAKDLLARARRGRTSSSRSPARRRACPPSRRRSSPACRST